MYVVALKLANSLHAIRLYMDATFQGWMSHSVASYDGVRWQKY